MRSVSSSQTLYEERRERANKQTVLSKDGAKKPAGKRDNPVVFKTHSAVEIVTHPHLWSDRQEAAAALADVSELRIG